MQENRPKFLRKCRKNCQENCGKNRQRIDEKTGGKMEKIETIAEKRPKLHT